MLYQNENFDNIFKSAWFVIVTLSTVGYGDSYPESAVGKFLTVPIIVAGLLFMAMPISIVGNNFTVIWEERQVLVVVAKIRSLLELRNLQQEHAVQVPASLLGRQTSPPSRDRTHPTQRCACYPANRVAAAVAAHDTATSSKRAKTRVAPSSAPSPAPSPVPIPTGFSRDGCGRRRIARHAGVRPCAGRDGHQSDLTPAQGDV